jgi:Ca2+-binding EF-hand superfamily protein
MHREIFELLDVNKDDKISISEMDRVFRSINDDSFKDEMAAILVSIDPKFAGEFGFEDFDQLMRKKVFREMRTADVANAFKVFDKNNTGRVNTHEFQEIMAQVATAEGLLRPEEVQEFCRMADPKNEGSFSYEKFMKSLN